MGDERAGSKASDDCLERFRNANNGNSIDIVRAVTVEALTEVIVDRRQGKGSGPPTPTEYFASIMTALQGPISPQHVPLMFLLSVVLASVPKAVIRLKGEACLDIVRTVLKRADGDDEDDTVLVRYCLTVIGITLAAQESSGATWNRPKNMQAFHMLLTSVADSRPKVRKVAQSAAMVVLEGQQQCGAPFQAVCKMSTEALSQCSIQECTRILRLLSFLHASLSLVTAHCSQKDIGSLAEELVKLSQLGHVQLGISSLTALREVGNGIDNCKWKASAKVKFLGKVTQSVANLMSNTQALKFITGDVKLCATWVETLQECESRVYKLSLEEKELCSFLPQVVEAYLSCISAGINLTEENGNPSSKPQVALPVGAISQLIQAELEVDQNPKLLSDLLDSLTPLLGPQFEEAWSIALDPMRAYFASRDGLERSPMVIKTQNDWIRKLGAIREKVINPVTGSDKPRLIIRWRGAVERVIGSAVMSTGVEQVLDVLPLSVEGGNEGVSPIRAWLLPILRNNVGTGKTATRLEYFRLHVLAAAERCEVRAQDDSIGPNSAKILRTRAIQLWSLLPGFCSNASDICNPGGFSALAPVLAQALQDERFPELTEYICIGLQHIIASCEEEPESKQVVSQFARKFLPLLFNLYDSLLCANAHDRADFVHKLISAYAAISDSSLLETLFKQLVHQLVVATTKQPGENQRSRAKSTGGRNRAKSTKKKDEDSDDSDFDSDEESEEEEEEHLDMAEIDEERRKTHILSSLALALVPSLNSETVTLLYRVIQPFLQDDEDQVLQKRGYRVLESICQNQVNWVLEKREELLALMQTSFFASSSNSKTARLKCLSYIVAAMGSTESELSPESVTEVVSELLGEVVLATKESNNKARCAAYKLVVVIGNCLREVYERSGQGLKGLHVYLEMLVAGLAASTPHMRSGAIGTLSRVFGEFGKVEDLQKELIQVAQTTLVLLQEKSREVAKSAIGFAKVCSVRLPVPSVMELLPDILKGLLPWANDTKNRFSLKIRVILERLTKRVGSDAICACNVIPQDHKLLTYIRKQAAYKKRRYERRKEENRNGNRMQVDEKDNENDDEFEEEEEDDMFDGKKKHSNKGKGGKRKRGGSEEDIIMDEGGEALDLLGASALGRVKRRSGKNQKPQQTDEEFKVAKDGRIIIPEEEGAQDDDDDKLFDRRRRTNYTEDSEDDEEDVDARADRPSKTRKVERPAGSEFKSRKAGGDVKKKQSKFEPYAYIQLNPKLLNKRRKHESARQFRGLSGKKFQEKGSKNSNKPNRKRR
mmetsp:Transcript_31383/g.50296  ORF Transcript_31383/g.50296 Transcript_31383/m.50296 type:complete len:1284 (-) Transcript_31383:1601-5452(-)|eukprot:CAMPEP_0203748806 /NCGR_PEP_ID=MMETSP0098-20131031/3590_1 /ASSEMBLY_ACC=CAM_ASM_000208 /TAXON_ID=96639 /ORGANISM=" , Strain NY0313808BC1" /LENGTH=1283 /DNA_ID=CAMNT_0050637681 /DNA_START=259 /DNA_END=4110 /DNA_ORIENTATION=+